MDKKTIVIVGAGVGLSHHIAEQFGQNGFRVVLMARREEKLREYVAELEAKGIEAEYQVTDCSSTASIVASFDAVKQKYGVIDVLEYNAAVMQGGFATVISPDELVERYRVDVAGALCAAQQVIPGQKEKGNGTILFTGGGLGLAPSSSATSMSLHKAALRALAIALHDELKDSGIYVGIVNIKGGIGMDEYYATDRVAKLFWQMYLDRREVEFTH